LKIVTIVEDATVDDTPTTPPPTHTPPSTPVDKISSEAIPDEVASKEDVPAETECVESFEKPSDEIVQKTSEEELTENSVPVTKTPEITPAIETEIKADKNIEESTKEMEPFIVIDAKQMTLEDSVETELTLSVNTATENDSQSEVTLATPEKENLEAKIQSFKQEVEETDEPTETDQKIVVSETVIEPAELDEQSQSGTPVLKEDIVETNPIISEETPETEEPIIIAVKLDTTEVEKEAEDTVCEETINENDSNLSSDKPPLSPKPTNFVTNAAIDMTPKSTENENMNPNEEDEEDEEDDEVIETDENFSSEILKHRGMGSVRRSMQMFQSASDESAKPKASQHKMTRRLSQRTSYRTDQPSQTGSGQVVRVAVPFPENHKEKVAVRAPVKTGRMDPLWDSKDKVQKPVEVLQMWKSSNTTQSVTPPEKPTETKMADIQHISPITASTSTEKANGDFTCETTTIFEVTGDVVEPRNVKPEVVPEESMFTFASIKIGKEDLQSKTTMSKDDHLSVAPICQEDNESTVAHYGDFDEQSMASTVVSDERILQTIDQVLKQIDFDAEPREVLVKASRSKGASLGLSIIAAEEEPEASKLANNTIIVKEVLDIDGTTWTGEMPKPGDVLESVDGSACNNDIIHDIIGECGNLIQLKFQRYPSAFTGYM